jgi:hypothetical protein
LARDGEAMARVTVRVRVRVRVQSYLGEGGECEGASEGRRAACEAAEVARAARELAGVPAALEDGGHEVVGKEDGVEREDGEACGVAEGGGEGGWLGLMGRDGMGWDGMGWDGVGWDGIGRNGMSFRRKRRRESRVQVTIERREEGDAEGERSAAVVAAPVEVAGRVNSGAEHGYSGEAEQRVPVGWDAMR